MTLSVLLFTYTFSMNVFFFYPFIMNKHPVSVVKTRDTNRIGLILVFHEKKKSQKKKTTKDKSIQSGVGL